MATRTSDLFAHHDRHWRTNRYVYPVVSRRSKGLSIGINLNPDKVCNFGCVYCCVDRSRASEVVDVDLDLVQDELAHLLQLAYSGEIWKQPPFDAAPREMRRINDVAFSGDGEPTSYPQFGRACERVVETIQRGGFAPAPKIVVITNATLLHRTRVAEGLRFLDRHGGEIWAKLDAGTEPYYRRIERSRVPFSRILRNLEQAGQVRPIVVQSLFLQLDGQGPDEAEIAAYVGRLEALLAGGCQIKRVQVYTVARHPAEHSVGPLEDGRLDAIAQRIRDTVNLPAEAFYGTGGSGAS